MRHILSDARFALRMMRGAPAFYATLLSVLVLGIGATTAMFSIVDSVLLRPLPYPHPEELTSVSSYRQGETTSSCLPDFVDLRAQARTLSKLAAISLQSFSLSAEGARPESVGGALVTGDFFPLLQIPPLLGRLLSEDDDRLGSGRSIVLSAALWHRRFGSDPTVVGRAILLDTVPYTVVGVAPEGFVFSGLNSSGDDVWVPLAAARADYAKELVTRGDHFVRLLARRQPGVSVAQAQAELSGIAARLADAYPESNAKRGVRVEDLHAAMVGPSYSGIWVLFAAVSLVFLGVCANVANLLLARAQTRRGEMAARAALGATPGRLAAQVLTETVVVFLFAAAGGSLLSHALVDTFARGVVSGSGAQTLEVKVDAVALAFTVVASLLCGVVFGLVPALALARVPPQAVLKESESRSGVGPAQRFLRSGLVVAQVAIAFALLVGSGLALRAYARSAAMPLGFDPDSLATGRLELPSARYDTDAKIAAFYAEAVARLAALPGVQSAAVDSGLPLGGSRSSGSLEIEGRPPFPRGEEPEAIRHSVTPDYFTTMRIPLLRGRLLTADDRAGTRNVALIGESIARKYFPGEDPIGHRISSGESDDLADPARWIEIVGIVGDVVNRPGEIGEIQVFRPFAQSPSSWAGIVARGAGTSAILKAMPGAVQSVDPDQAMWSLRSMNERVAAELRSDRFIALLLSAFAVAALLLASLGLFGLVSYTTRQRTREFGIRMALGSTPEQLVGLVVQGGMRLVGFGLAVGLGGALLAGRILAERMSGVVPFDLALYVAIPIVLSVSGLLACVLPARQAVRTPPAVALRYE